MPNGKNKQGKLIQHVLILATSHSLIKKTYQWLEAKTNIQSSLDRNFIFTGTDNLSKLQLRNGMSSSKKEATLTLGRSSLMRSMND